MLNLTRQERQVILFLVFIALFSMAVSFIFKRYPQTKSLTYEVRKINLNQADLQSLVSVPGIGEKLAERIIKHREAKVEFKDIEELKEIKGISKSKFELIKDYFIIE